MAPLVVLTGPPGAGKSTVGELLAGSFERSALVGGDAFYGFLARGAIIPWEDAATGQNEVCTAAAGAACGRFAAGGFTVVFDGMVGPWFLSQFLAATGLPALDYAVLLPPEELVVERVRTRVGHGFRDEAAARHMHREFVRSDPDPRHLITVADGPDQIAAAIAARLAAGSLRYPAV